MGNHRLSLVAWLVISPFVLFADWGDSDTVILSNISSDLSDIRDIYSYRIYNALIEVSPYRFAYRTRDDALLSFMQSFEERLLASFCCSNVVSSIDSFHDDFNDYSSSVTSSLDTLTASLDDQYSLLFSAFGDVTNSLSSISSAIANIDLTVNPGGVGVLNTNLFAYLSDNFYGLGTDYSFVLRYVFEALYGRRPNAAELSNLSELYYFGPTHSFAQSIATSLSLQALVGTDMYTYIYELLDSYLYGDGHEYVGDAMYYEYGTRPLIEFFEHATNDYPLSSSAIETSQGQSSFTPGFLGAVSSLSSSFMPTVSTNIATVNTNAIVSTPNQSYQQAYQDLIESEPDSDPDLIGLMGLANSTTPFEDFAASLSSSPGDVVWSFDFAGFESGVKVDAKLTSVKSKISDVFHFIFSFLEALVFVYTCYMCWQAVVGVEFARRD